jgi:hypothetical protein
MADMDLKALAQILQKQGRGNDTVLAHITKKEAERLKRDGGSGTINPNTGLPEFDDSGYMAGADYTGYDTPSYQPDFSVQAQPQAQVEPSGGGYDPATQISGNLDFSSGSMQPVQNAPAGGGGYPSAPPVQLAPSYSGRAPVTSENISFPSMTAAAGAVPDYSAGAPVPAAADGNQEQQSIASRLSKALGIDEGNLSKYGLAGLQGLMGAYTANKAQKQGQQAKAEQAKIAQPYQQQGKQLVDQAQRGELSAASQQQLQAAQAQVNQGVEARGGVGAAQANAQIETLRQQLLNQQYQLGLQISGIGDQIALGAIKAGIQADQYVNQLTNNYFTNIARTAMGAAPAANQQTIPSNYGAIA